MGNNYIKHLGIKPDVKIGTKEFNAIWAKYAEKDNTMKKRNAIKFLRDFGVAVNVKVDDQLIEKLLKDAGVGSVVKVLTKDVFTNLFFANAEKSGHAALTQSVMAIKRRGQSQPRLDTSEVMVDKSGKEKILVEEESLDTSTVKTPLSPQKSELELQIEQLFVSYADENYEVIESQGLLKFLTDLEIPPNDVALLVLAYHMDAATMGIFTKSEFIKGLSKFRLTSIGAIKEIIPKLREEITSDQKFAEIYKFAHQFYKENPNHKVIALDIADSVLEMLANDRPHIPRFRKFLYRQKEYKGINQDQWTNILDFSSSVSLDLGDYQESSSWPYLIDLYVEWVQEGHTGESEEEKEVKKEKKVDEEYEFAF